MANFSGAICRAGSGHVSEGYCDAQQGKRLEIFAVARRAPPAGEAVLRTIPEVKCGLRRVLGTNHDDVTLEERCAFAQARPERVVRSQGLGRERLVREGTRVVRLEEGLDRRPVVDVAVGRKNRETV